MKKILACTVAILMALSMAVVFTGCGGDDVCEMCEALPEGMYCIEHTPEDAGVTVTTDPEPIEECTCPECECDEDECVCELPCPDCPVCDDDDPIADDCECVDCEDCDACECEDCECPNCDHENDPDDTTEPNGDDTTEPNGDDTTEPGATTTTGTGNNATTATTTTTSQAERFAPPANLGSLPAAQQLEYFNLVVNRVRTETPAFRQRYRLSAGSAEIEANAIIRGIFTPILNAAIPIFLPGTWNERPVPANYIRDRWFANNAEGASMLRPQDIASINSVRNGNNWVITVRVREEINPTPGMASANGRLHQIMTRQQILDEIIDDIPGVTANPNDARLRYHGGHAVVTVNPQGQITHASGGFQVAASVNNISIPGGTVPALHLPQTTEHIWDNFRW